MSRLRGSLVFRARSLFAFIRHTGILGVGLIPSAGISDHFRGFGGGTTNMKCNDFHDVHAGRR